jgi:hypothetical protein
LAWFVLYDPIKQVLSGTPDALTVDRVADGTEALAAGLRAILSPPT